MNAFDYVSCIKDIYGGSYDDKGHDEYVRLIAEKIRGAERSIQVYSGEFKLVSEPGVLGAYRERKKEIPALSFRAVCGDRIVSTKDERGDKTNAFLRALGEDEDLRANCEIYYNYFELYDQVNLGYFHCVIVDDGAFVMVQQPHGYSESSRASDGKRMLFENNPVLAEKLKRSYDHYIEFYNLEPLDAAERERDEAFRPTYNTEDELDAFDKRISSERPDREIVDRNFELVF